MSTINNSVQFLVSSREALTYIIKESSVKNKEDLCDFIINEASDYQVMSLLLRGELPEEKQDLYEEIKLFDEFTASILENADELSESFGFHSVKELSEVSSISVYGLGSAAPILEHILSTGGISLNEAVDIKALTRILSKVMDPQKAEVMAIRIAKKSYDAGEAIKTAKNYVAGKLATAGKSASSAAAAAGKSAGDAAAKAGHSIKNSAIDAAGKVGGGKYAGKIAGASDKAVGVGAGLAAAAVAAAAVYAGYKIYKRFFSQAAKACGGKSGSEKSACMVQFKKKALMAQAAEVSKGMSKCSKSSNPEKCKAAIKAKVDSIKAKAAKS